MTLFDLAWQILCMNMPLFCRHISRGEIDMEFRTSTTEAIYVFNQPDGSVRICGVFNARACECLGINVLERTMMIWNGEPNHLLLSVQLDRVSVHFGEQNRGGATQCYVWLVIDDPWRLEKILSHMTCALSIPVVTLQDEFVEEDWQV